MILITINCWIKNSNLNTSLNFDLQMKRFDKAWIISFIIFFLIHNLTSHILMEELVLTWILLSGMRSIIREYSVSKEIS